MIAIGITAMSIFYYYFNAFQMRKLEDQKLVHVSNLTAYQYSLRALLNSQNAFMASAQHASNSVFYRCLNQPDYDCNVTNPQDFTLVNADGTVLNDSSNASSGIDSGMQACTSFPSVSCPFRFELKWSRECVAVSGPCYSPDLYIRGQLVVADLPSVKFNINPANYIFEVKVR